MQSLHHIWLGLGITATLVTGCVDQPGIESGQRAAAIAASDDQCDAAPAVDDLGGDITGSLTDLDTSFACVTDAPSPIADARRARVATSVPAPVVACAVLIEPSALDQQIADAQDAVTLRTQQLGIAQQNGFTPPEIAEAKLRLAKAQYALTKLQVQKALQNAANAPNPARARADAAVQSAEADLALAQATLAAAQARVTALNQIVNFAACQAELLAAQLAASDAANAVTTATAKLVAAKAAQQAIAP